ncbi:MAG: hypothetical protein Q9222_002904 [Ikaeria aurantiellina]
MSSMEELFDDACAKNTIPGAVLFAANSSGTFRYENVFGTSSLRDPSSKPALKKDAVVAILSCTKLMTSIATMQLVEQGRLKLDEDVTTILPELKDIQILTAWDGDKPLLSRAENKITLRHLLTHNSGLCYDFLHPLMSHWRTTHPYGPDPVPSILEAYTCPLIYEPGTSWSYGPSLDFAGLMIERVSGLGLAAILHPTYMATAWDFRYDIPP